MFRITTCGVGLDSYSNCASQLVTVQGAKVAFRIIVQIWELLLASHF